MTDSNKKDEFVFFWGGSFSNFSVVRGGIDYLGENFPTSEHCFMYAKAKQFNDEEIARQIVNARTPKDAKRLGRKVKGYKDEEWSKVRYEIMKDINLLKYTQSKYHNQELKRTGNKHLVEASPFDDIWGIKMRATDKGVENPKNWKGQNLLGKVLMEVREELFNK